jgi:hypothetical protein
MENRDEKFYDQACAYFHYHAGQRTDMINYFIAIFGASMALYGSLLETIPLACVFISMFLFVATILFYFIDLRNKFDVKQSQEVICAFEQKYRVSDSSEHPAYGVFSNEDNTFILYDTAFRRSTNFGSLQKLYKKTLRHPNDSKLMAEYRKEMSEFRAKFGEMYPQVSESTLKKSLTMSSIPHLSSCIKILYYICMGVSVAGFIAALLLILL